MLAFLRAPFPKRNPDVRFRRYLELSLTMSLEYRNAKVVLVLVQRVAVAKYLGLIHFKRFRYIREDNLVTRWNCLNSRAVGVKYAVILVKRDLIKIF